MFNTKKDRVLSEYLRPSVVHGGQYPTRSFKWHFISLVIYLSIPSIIFAAGDFKVSQRVTYTYNEVGQANVEIKTSLTNLKTEVYPASYKLILTDEKPDKVTGFDGLGALKIDNTAGVLNIQFNQAVVGKGNTLTFTLKYQGNPAKRKGEVWEIVLPKLGNPEAIDDYQLKVVVPTSFGRPVQGEKLVFTKTDLIAGAVVALGNFQVYRFNLKYHLSKSGAILLPPDTPYQRIYYEKLAPAPKSLFADGDGNWLAEYETTSPLDIKTQGIAYVAAAPIYLSLPQKYTYLESTNLWPKSNVPIKTPEQIYDYVVGHLKYGNGVNCVAFTNLFISLARTNGFPARQLVGFGYTTDQEKRPLGFAPSLHTWPEYWDNKPRTWVSVDPTWGQTTGGIDYFHKFDFNHFVFAIYGLTDTHSEVLPYVIQVNLEKYRYQPPPKLDLSFDLLKFAFIVHNTSGQAIYRDKYGVFLPFTSREFPTPFTLRNPKIVIGEQIMTYNNPIKWYLLYGTGTIVFVAIVAYIIRRVHLQKRLRQHYLHWQGQKSS